MKNLLKFLSNLTMTGLVNLMLISIALLIAVTGIVLTALYVIKYVDASAPEMKTLQCTLGIMRDDCVDYQKKYDDLVQKRDALMQEMTSLKYKLKNLTDIANNTDSVTLFDIHPIPNTSFSVTVGTVYKDLLSETLTPTYFCYIGLGSGTLNEDRNLNIRNDVVGDIAVNSTHLARIGLDANAMNFARSKCKPYLITKGDV
jgi:hypothetical protein